MKMRGGRGGLSVNLRAQALRVEIIKLSKSHKQHEEGKEAKKKKKKDPLRSVVHVAYSMYLSAKPFARNRENLRSTIYGTT